MKKYILGLFAVVLAIGFSAFTAKKNLNTQYGLKSRTIISSTDHLFEVVDMSVLSANSVPYDCVGSADNCKVTLTLPGSGVTTSGFWSEIKTFHIDPTQNTITFQDPSLKFEY